MNLLERYRQFKVAKEFNSADIKSVITINGYSFDIRLVNNELYCNGIELEDFFYEGGFTIDERLIYEEAIYDWLSKSQVA